MKALQIALKFLDTLPEDMRDDNIRTENQKKSFDLLVSLLDKYAAYKRLYDDLPPTGARPEKKGEASGDQL